MWTVLYKYICEIHQNELQIDWFWRNFQQNRRKIYQNRMTFMQKSLNLMWKSTKKHKNMQNIENDSILYQIDNFWWKYVLESWKSYQIWPMVCKIEILLYKFCIIQNTTSPRLVFYNLGLEPALHQSVALNIGFWSTVGPILQHNVWGGESIYKKTCRFENVLRKLFNVAQPETRAASLVSRGSGPSIEDNFVSLQTI